MSGSIHRYDATILGEWFLIWRITRHHIQGSKCMISIQTLEDERIIMLYVQVMHRDKLPIKQPTRCINIQHLFCHKTPNVSGIFCAHHQELSTVRTAIGTFHAGYVTAS